MNASNVRVLLADGQDLSGLSRDIVEHDPGMEIVGSAPDGVQAIDLASRLHPDVIAMSLDLPRWGGLDTARKITQVKPIPIIILVKDAQQEAEWKSRIAESGAVAVAQRPLSGLLARSGEVSRHLVQTLRAMSEVKMVRRWSRAGSSATPGSHVTEVRV